MVSNARFTSEERPSPFVWSLNKLVLVQVVGGLAYAAFLYAKKNDDSGSGGGGSDDESLAEAKRIMDKYK